LKRRRRDMDKVLEAFPELVRLRVRVDLVQQDLSEAVHMLYCLLVWIATSPRSELKQRTLTLLKVKFLQMPQGFCLGRALIDLDEQFGNKLEGHGVNLKRWVYEPREHRNG
jgi:hypothetical protein